MPTVQEKNIVIAEMLGWKRVDWFSEDTFLRLYKGVTIPADYILTIHNFRLSHHCYEIDELKFHSDANWQFEAIEWVENEGYPIDVCQEYCSILTNIQPTNEILGCEGETKKEAIFEALYQFSQYLKKKE